MQIYTSYYSLILTLLFLDFFSELSDQGSELVSPVSSLPPETPTLKSSFTIPPVHPGQSSPIKTPSSILSLTPLSSLPSSVNHSPSTSPIKQHPLLEEAPSNTSQISYSSTQSQAPRPGSLALSSLAEAGVLSDQAGYLNRPGSLAAPCNTVGIPPAPTRAVSAATGLNHAPQYGYASRQMFSSRPNDGGILYTIQQETPTSPNGHANINFSQNGSQSTTPTPLSPLQSPVNGSISYQNPPKIHSQTNIPAPGKYASPSAVVSTKLPLSKQTSSSSMLPQPSTRIPGYSTQFSSGSTDLDNNKAILEQSSRIPSLASTGRSYSNMSNSSVQNGQRRASENNSQNLNGTAGLRSPPTTNQYKQSPKDSKIPQTGSISTKSLNSYNAKTIQQPSKIGNIQSPYSSLQKSKPSTNLSYAHNESSSSINSHDTSFESRLPSLNSSFGKSGIPSYNSPASKSSSRPPSLNSSIDSRDGRQSSQSRIVGPSVRTTTQYSSGGFRSYLKSPTSPSSYGGHSSPNPSVPPAQQAINLSGLPPPPAVHAGAKPSGIPSSRIPQFGTQGQFMM